MSKLDLTQAKTYSQARVLGTVCEGLAKVCELMIQDAARVGKRARQFEQYSSEFDAMARWWLRQADIEDRKEAEK